eukprot:Blabericola_migrator_1__2648@NODE_1750_length_3862_cov_96_765481_g1127_i0_p1_GENE_NODE_1750_length_3862_cov_96_765481_g1127_i0NODE_1750_length_3862_cov_96_765481_g1127_i0_p1_ORF_typecomplete_len665_score76_39_NODE_1750_length_3862_cov_96_765481_g1127_i09272921
MANPPPWVQPAYTKRQTDDRRYADIFTNWADEPSLLREDYPKGTATKRSTSNRPRRDENASHHRRGGNYGWNDIRSRPLNSYSPPRQAQGTSLLNHRKSDKDCGNGTSSKPHRYFAEAPNRSTDPPPRSLAQAGPPKTGPANPLGEFIPLDHAPQDEPPPALNLIQASVPLSSYVPRVDVSVAPEGRGASTSHLEPAEPRPFGWSDDLNPVEEIDVEEVKQASADASLEVVAPSSTPPAIPASKLPAELAHFRVIDDNEEGAIAEDEEATPKAGSMTRTGKGGAPPNQSIIDGRVFIEIVSDQEEEMGDDRSSRKKSRPEDDMDIEEEECTPERSNCAPKTVSPAWLPELSITPSDTTLNAASSHTKTQYKRLVERPPALGDLANRVRAKRMRDQEYKASVPAEFPPDKVPRITVGSVESSPAADVDDPPATVVDAGPVTNVLETESLVVSNPMPGPSPVAISLESPMPELSTGAMSLSQLIPEFDENEIRQCGLYVRATSECQSILRRISKDLKFYQQLREMMVQVKSGLSPSLLPVDLHVVSPDSDPRVDSALRDLQMLLSSLAKPAESSSRSVKAEAPMPPLSPRSETPVSNAARQRLEKTSLISISLSNEADHMESSSVDVSAVASTKVSTKSKTKKKKHAAAKSKPSKKSGSGTKEHHH